MVKSKRLHTFLHFSAWSAAARSGAFRTSRLNLLLVWNQLTLALLLWFSYSQQQRRFVDFSFFLFFLHSRDIIELPTAQSSLAGLLKERREMCGEENEEIGERAERSDGKEMGKKNKERKMLNVSGRVFLNTSDKSFIISLENQSEAIIISALRLERAFFCLFF